MRIGFGSGRSSISISTKKDDSHISGRREDWEERRLRSGAAAGAVEPWREQRRRRNWSRRATCWSAARDGARPTGLARPSACVRSSGQARMGRLTRGDARRMEERGAGSISSSRGGTLMGKGCRAVVINTIAISRHGVGSMEVRAFVLMR